MYKSTNQHFPNRIQTFSAFINKAYLSIDNILNQLHPIPILTTYYSETHPNIIMWRVEIPLPPNTTQNTTTIMSPENEYSRSLTVSVLHTFVHTLKQDNKEAANVYKIISFMQTVTSRIILHSSV
jgi:hypothetical protein